MWEQVRANQRRSALLVVAMAAVLIGLGYVLGQALDPGGGPVGVGVAVVLWVILALVSYYQGGGIMLAVGGARPIEKADFPQLFNVVEEMQIAAGLPRMPDIYVIDDPAPNAFATGRNPQTAAVAVTTGLLRICNRDELQGVIAHELGHIRNRDILLMIMVGVMMGAIVLLADIGWRLVLNSGGRRRTRSSRGEGQGQIILILVAVALAILAPIIARLMYFAMSRRREYLADASAALLTRYPEGLASALEKIGASSRRLDGANRATAPMYIVNPFQAGSRAAFSLAATHPPLDDRIRVLRAMGGGAGYVDYDSAFRRIHAGRGVLPAGATAGQKPVPGRPATTDTSVGPQQRARAAMDAVWRSGDYRFLPCACGATLKLPPDFTAARLVCPRCRHVHALDAVPPPLPDAAVQPDSPRGPRGA